MTSYRSNKSSIYSIQLSITIDELVERRWESCMISFLHGCKSVTSFDHPFCSITLLCIQLPLCGPSEDNTRMSEKLRKETQVQTELPTSHCYLHYEGPRRWVTLCLAWTLGFTLYIEPLLPHALSVGLLTGVGLRNEERVVVGMVSVVEIMVVKGPVSPIVHSFCWAHVQKKHYEQTFVTPERVGSASKGGHRVVCNGHQKGRQEDIVFPTHAQNQKANYFFVGEHAKGGFPCMLLIHQTLVGIRTKCRWIWWIGFVSVDQPLLSYVFSGRMEV